jgi:alanine racemase
LNNWIEISDQALASNFHALQHAAGASTEVLAVIKANAYGHGAERCASILIAAGATWLGVTCAEEGRRVRAAAGDAADILIMSGFLPEDVLAIRDFRLIPALWTQEQIASLAGLKDQKIHVEVDTGMGRQGVLPGPELDALLLQIQSAGLILDGIFTHFCSSEVADSPLTRDQQQRFEQAIAQVAEAGMHPRWIHAGNSSALDNPAKPSAWLATLAASKNTRALVRPGIALYGFCLPIEGEAQPCVQPNLQPVMTWLARVLSVRSLAPGETVGYNATFTADRPMRVAVLPVGYADGLRRELSTTNQRPGGWAMLRGQCAPILGRVSMNLTVVDVTEIPGVEPGDTATVLGPGISATDHARLARTIVYEILCGIHPCT